MNPTDIFEALEAIAKAPFDPAEFGFSFAEATDNAQATVSKLRGGSLNRSDIEGGVLMNLKFHYAPADALGVEATLDALKGSKRTAKHKPAILIATDGETVAAEHWKSGERLHCAFSEIGDHFGFFLPAAGKDRYRPAEENPVDVKATGKLAKLYDALVKANPDWATDARRHDMNQFMTRLIFCMFAEDVGIFPENQFSRAIFTHAGDKGEEAHGVLISAFQAMNLPKNKRTDLPAWSHDLEYVNGGLFAGTIDAPRFDVIAFRYLREACDLDWKEINPDIFGSMIQSVADPKARAELGMHYTSVPNIMKVLGPLFLDELDAEIDKAWDRPNGLRKVLDRMSAIRVFDPACGSGNFLVVAYRELRAREIRILRRLGEIEGQTQIQMWSQIPITNFYGIEITDFSAETAKLAMFIAEYQANAMFGEAFGRKPAALPLKVGASIRNGNALRIDWADVCSPLVDGEVFIAGNPPFLGGRNMNADQKADVAHAFRDFSGSHKALDMVAAWYLKASEYIRGKRAAAALVATNSICQGASVPALWPKILADGLEISFAHRTFKWRNNASANAAVMCVVVGLRNSSGRPKWLFDETVRNAAANINAYLLDADDSFVTPERISIFGLPEMLFGNMPRDGGHLILDQSEAEMLKSSGYGHLVRRYMGSEEVIKGKERWCLWIEDHQVDEARTSSFISERLDAVASNRLESPATSTQDFSNRPHRFVQIQGVARDHSILVPSVSSERRPYLPVARFGADTISSNLNQAIYDAPEWCIALIASRIHLVWIATVCGKLKSDFRYSNTLGWNTFPVPAFTESQLEALSQSARAILKTRYKHHPATIADLYDPDKMPEDLRAAHRANDDLLESMYIGRPFKTDTERLEHLFKLYAAKVKKLKKEAA
ncbi:class I SAM-dependent DNA methyltransferase [Sulfitobacter aestuarii]|uniref:site-specific DNA-methyltransferase (adenine-specific) n=1 Tax=Sulfitobacter aestuarii TaxID=2161676 RepID=A0ABW5U6A4_9RHOB